MDWSSSPIHTYTHGLPLQFIAALFVFSHFFRQMNIPTATATNYNETKNFIRIDAFSSTMKDSLHSNNTAVKSHLKQNIQIGFESSKNGRNHTYMCNLKSNFLSLFIIVDHFGPFNWQIYFRIFGKKLSNTMGITIQTMVFMIFSTQNKCWKLIKY